MTFSLHISYTFFFFWSPLQYELIKIMLIILLSGHADCPENRLSRGDLVSTKG